MKYFAILKDSFREAIDSKILLVLVILSLIVIFLIASLSFESSEPDILFQQQVNRRAFRQVRADRGRSGLIIDYAHAHFTVSNVKAASDAARPEHREYDLTVHVGDTQPFGFWKTIQFWANENPDADIQIDKSAADKPDHATVESFFVKQFQNSGIDVSSVKVIRTTPPTKEAPEGSFEYVIRTKAMKDARNWPKHVNIGFGLVHMPVNVSVGMVVFLIEALLIGGFGALVALVISIIVTAFFIPNMLRKGTVDVLIAKPIHRTTLLLVKFIGGMTFMFLATALTIGGVWFVLGLRFGVWAPGFLLSIPILTFFFAVLYSISTLFAVLTRSTIASILLTFFVWFLFWIVGIVFGELDKLNRHGARENVSPLVYNIFSTLKDAVPTVNLGQLNTQVIASSVFSEREQAMTGFDRLPEIDRIKSVLVPCIWIAAMLALACWRFAVRDF